MRLLSQRILAFFLALSLLQPLLPAPASAFALPAAPSNSLYREQALSVPVLWALHSPGTRGWRAKTLLVRAAPALVTAAGLGALALFIAFGTRHDPLFTLALLTPVSRLSFLKLMFGGSQGQRVDELVEKLNRDADAKAGGRPAKPGVVTQLGEGDKAFTLTSQYSRSHRVWGISPDPETLKRAIAYGGIPGITLRLETPRGHPALAEGEAAVSEPSFRARGLPYLTFKRMRRALGRVPKAPTRFTIELEDGRRAEIFTRHADGEDVWAFRWDDREVFSQHYGFALAPEPGEALLVRELFTDKLGVRPFIAGRYLQQMVLAALGGKPKAGVFHKRLGEGDSAVELRARVVDGLVSWFVSEETAARLLALPKDLRAEDVAVSPQGFLARGLDVGFLENFFKELGPIPMDTTPRVFKVGERDLVLMPRLEGPIPMWSFAWDDRELVSKHFGLRLPPEKGEVAADVRSLTPYFGYGPAARLAVARLRALLGPPSHSPATKTVRIGDSEFQAVIRQLSNGHPQWHLNESDVAGILAALSAPPSPLIPQSGIMMLRDQPYVIQRVEPESGAEGNRLVYTLRSIESERVVVARVALKDALKAAEAPDIMAAAWQSLGQPDAVIGLPHKHPELFARIQQEIQERLRRTADAEPAPSGDLTAKIDPASARSLFRRAIFARLAQLSDEHLRTARAIGPFLERLFGLLLDRSPVTLAIVLNGSARADNGDVNPTLQLISPDGLRLPEGANVPYEILRWTAKALTYAEGSLVNLSTQSLSPPPKNGGVLETAAAKREALTLLFKPALFGDIEALETARRRALETLAASPTAESDWALIRTGLQSTYRDQRVPRLVEMMITYGLLAPRARPTPPADAVSPMPKKSPSFTEEQIVAALRSTIGRLNHPSLLRGLLFGISFDDDLRRRGITPLSIFLGRVVNVGLEAGLLDAVMPGVELLPENLVTVLRPLGIDIIGVDPKISPDHPATGFLNGMIQDMPRVADNSVDTLITIALLDPDYPQASNETDFYSKIAAEAKRVLRNGGIFLAETIHAVPQFVNAMKAAGFEPFVLGRHGAYLFINRKNGGSAGPSGPDRALHRAA